MGEIHELVTKHGRERAKALVSSEDRYLVDLAAEVLGDEALDSRLFGKSRGVPFL